MSLGIHAGHHVSLVENISNHFKSRANTHPTNTPCAHPSPHFQVAISSMLFFSLGNKKERRLMMKQCISSYHTQASKTNGSASDFVLNY